MSRHVPTINTARTTLRAMRPSDFDRFADIWAMPDATAFVGGVRSRNESWNSFLRNSGHWQITGFGQWAVEEHSARRVVGQAGFFFGGRELGDDFDSVPEAGWLLTPDVHGKGLGREVTEAAHDWFDRVITGPLVCRVGTDNAASLRLAARLGYVPLRKAASEGGKDFLLMTRKSPPQGT